jgi:hypothetical protein
MDEYFQTNEVPRLFEDFCTAIGERYGCESITSGMLGLRCAVHLDAGISVAANCICMSVRSSRPHCVLKPLPHVQG